MQFDRDFGFNVEYHNFCGFDKLHVISGLYGPNEQFDRIARFCGPRDGFGTAGQPWDGARNMYRSPDKENMPFWDVPYTFENNKVSIGWDSDQTKTTGGFRLKWWAVEEERSLDAPQPCKYPLSENNPCNTIWPILNGNQYPCLDSTLKGSLELMRGQIEPLIINQPTLPIRVRDRQMTQLHNVLDKLEKAVETKGPNGEKSCSHMDTFEPPNDKLRIVSFLPKAIFLPPI